MIDFNNDKHLAGFIGTLAVLLVVACMYGAFTVSTTWSAYKAKHKQRMIEATELCGDPATVPPVDYGNCISEAYQRSLNIEQAERYSQ